jgi:hypothetical protein
METGERPKHQDRQRAGTTDARSETILAAADHARSTIGTVTACTDGGERRACTSL